MDTVAVSRTSRRGLGVVLPFLVGSCGELRSADQVSIRVDSDQMTWESADGDLWGIVDLLEKDGVIWVLTSVDPFVHGLQRGEEVVTFGRLGEGPDELRSARALLDRGDAGEITIWDPASRLYRTFSTTGSLVSTRDAGSMSAVLRNIGLVTFGDALRVAATTKGTVRAEYPGAVSSGGDLSRISHTGKPEASEGRVEAVTSVANGVGAKKKPPAGVFGAAGKEIDWLKGPSLVSGRSGAVSARWNKCSRAAGSYPGNRAWTRANAAAEGCAESMATLTRRTETMTRAPILRSLSRSVPAVARASRVP